MTKKQLQEYIEEIRPKADAYDRVCSTLGIDKDILGYIEKIKANQVEPLFMQTEPAFTKEFIMKSVREEIKESYFMEMSKTDFDNKLYTILGIIDSALKR